MPRAFVDPRFGAEMRRLLDEQGMTYRALAARTYHGKSYLQELAAGKKPPTMDTARRIDDALGADGALLACVAAPVSAGVSDDELDAVELARRVEASDVSPETLTRLEAAVDELATAYAGTPPVELLPRVRRHLAYIGQLVDARMTPTQRRRLLVAGGWLSLLAATMHIDLRQGSAAQARLVTAAQLAGHAEHAEIAAWCLETRAWDVLTTGDYQRAVELSRRAQDAAPRGSSAHIQAIAQEGRAWARMRQRAQTRDALDRVDRLVASLPVPDRPEHHYRYDPDKALSYAATTLAWAGDPAAEEYARAVIDHLSAPNGKPPRPRRIASAQLDLGLALLAAGKPDEASAVAVAAIASGRVVPSNWWRATEILTGVERTGVPEADDLREAYLAHRPSALPQQ